MLVQYARPNGAICAPRKAWLLPMYRKITLGKSNRQSGHRQMALGVSKRVGQSAPLPSSSFDLTPAVLAAHRNVNQPVTACFGLRNHVVKTASVRAGSTPCLCSSFSRLTSCRFASHVLIDTTPLPDSIPKVKEIGASSAPLLSASYFIGARCKPYNDDYMMCKTENPGRGELECMREGRKVTRCAASV
jgi:hypothetical protein